MSPELNSRLQAIRAKLEGGGQSGDALADMKLKLAKREGAGGYTQNVTELRQRIETMENSDDS